MLIDLAAVLSGAADPDEVATKYFTAASVSKAK